MSVVRQPPVLLSPTHPTPLSPPLTLSPLDVSMLQSRLDIVYIYQKASQPIVYTRTTSSSATTINAVSPTSTTAFSSPSTQSIGSSAASSSASSTTTSAPSSRHTSPRQYSVAPSSTPRANVWHAQSNPDAPFLSVTLLQQALRDTLSDYHVLAGRLTVNGYGHQAIRLSDDGLAWISAEADVALDTILPSGQQRLSVYDLHHLPAALLTPLPSMPSSTSPLMYIQYTRFSCGSVCLGVTVYHGIMDPNALFMFMNCWAHSARQVKYVRPSHDRTVVTNMRANPQTDFIHTEYIIVAKKPKPTNTTNNGHINSSNTSSSNNSTSPTNASVLGTVRASSAATSSATLHSSSPAAPANPINYSLKVFHFTKREIERMKAATTSSQHNSPRYVDANIALPPSPTLTTQASTNTSNSSSNSNSSNSSSGYLVGAAGLQSPRSQSGALNRDFFVPASPPSSAPNSPRNQHLTSSAAGENSLPYHAEYISTFDVLAAHLWQVIIRARYPGAAAYIQNKRDNTSPIQSPLSATSPPPSVPSSPSSARASFHQRHASTPRAPNPLLTSVPEHVNNSNSSSSNGSTPPAAASSKTEEEKSRDKVLETVTNCTIAFNGRNRLDPPLPDVYCGNVTFFAMVPLTIQQLLSSDLHTLSRLIRDKMNTMVDDYLRSVLTILAKPPPPNARLLPAFQTQTTDVLFTSFLKSPLYATDFGTGCPVFVGVTGGGNERSRWEGYAAFIRTALDDGSVDVSLCLKEEEMKRMEKDERLRMFRIRERSWVNTASVPTMPNNWDTTLLTQLETLRLSNNSNTANTSASSGGSNAGLSPSPIPPLSPVHPDSQNSSVNRTYRQ